MNNKIYQIIALCSLYHCFNVTIHAAQPTSQMDEKHTAQRNRTAINTNTNTGNSLRSIIAKTVFKTAGTLGAIGTICWYGRQQPLPPYPTPSCQWWNNLIKAYPGNGFTAAIQFLFKIALTGALINTAWYFSAPEHYAAKHKEDNANPIQAHPVPGLDPHSSSAYAFVANIFNAFSAPSRVIWSKIAQKGTVDAQIANDYKQLCCMMPFIAGGIIILLLPECDQMLKKFFSAMSDKDTIPAIPEFSSVMASAALSLSTKLSQAINQVTTVSGIITKVARSGSEIIPPTANMM